MYIKQLYMYKIFLSLTIWGICGKIYNVNMRTNNDGFKLFMNHTSTVILLHMII